MKKRKRKTETPATRSLPQSAVAAGVLVVTVAAPALAGRFDYPPQALLYTAVAVLAALWLAWNHVSASPPPRAVSLLWLLAVWTGVTAFVSVYRHATELEFARLAALAGWSGLTAALCREKRGREAWLAAVSAGGGIVAWIGIAQYAATADRSWRTFSTFYNPNELATALVVAALCAAGLVFGTTHRPLRVLALTAVISCLAALPLTGSRGGGLAFVAGALVFGLCMGRRLWEFVAPSARGVLVVLLVVAGGVAARPLALRVLHGGAIQHSESFRVKTWEGAVRMIAARPVTGFGGGAFEYAYPRYAEVGFTRAAHNIYLQLAAEQGVPGLLLFLAALAAALAAPTGRVAETSLSIGMKAALVGVAVHGLVDYGWQVPALALWTAGLIGGAAAGERPKVRRRFAATALTVLPPAALAATTAALIIPEWGAQRRGDRAAEAAARGSLNVAAERYVEALHWSPRSEQLHLELAAVLEAIADRSEFGATEALAEAERHYRRAASLAPTHASALRRLGEFYYRQKRFPAALHWLERAVAAFPNYTAAYYALGETQRALHHLGQAERAYRRVLAIADGPAGQLQAVPELAFDVAVARAALRLAVLYHDRREWRKSLAAAERGLREMQRYRKSAAYRRSLAAAAGLGAPLSSAEADLLEGELDVYAAVAQWRLGNRHAFRAAAHAALAVDDGMAPLLRTLLPADAVTEVDGL